MSVLPIVQWPDARLSCVCNPVVGDVADLARDMFDTMYAANGRGLAAPQIGVMSRVFVMDCGWKDGDHTPLVCIDPTIISASDTVSSMEEGCLSIPSVLVPVVRPDGVVLSYRDLEGALHHDTLNGFAARCAQHELDHLDGLVHFDRVANDMRDLYVVKYLAEVKNERS